MQLFFGSRHENEDFIFKNEIEECLKTKVLRKFKGAFSRDQVYL